jgi:hypothetical protein
MRAPRTRASAHYGEQLGRAPGCGNPSFCSAGATAEGASPLSEEQEYDDGGDGGDAGEEDEKPAKCLSIER